MSLLPRTLYGYELIVVIFEKLKNWQGKKFKTWQEKNIDREKNNWQGKIILTGKNILSLSSEFFFPCQKLTGKLGRTYQTYSTFVTQNITKMKCCHQTQKTRYTLTVASTIGPSGRQRVWIDDFDHKLSSKSKNATKGAKGERNLKAL